MSHLFMVAVQLVFASVALAALFSDDAPPYSKRREVADADRVAKLASFRMQPERGSPQYPEELSSFIRRRRTGGSGDRSSDDDQSAADNETSDANQTSSSNQSSGSTKKCFPRYAIVELESGLLKSMDELNIGDRIKVGPGQFSDVYMFTHRDGYVHSNFVVIGTSSDDTITLTHGHYIYLNGALVAAQYAKIGDEITLGSGVVSKVVTVRETIGTGLYNPQTLHGDIVVDGIVASTYTTAVSPTLGHASLTLSRTLYAVFGIGGGSMQNGADAIANVLPGGPVSC